ncbi:2910_t:CDS:2, partial [Dentiscutata erythropus]
MCLDCANDKLLQLNYCANFICFISGCGKKMTLANILEITKTKAFSDPTSQKHVDDNGNAADITAKKMTCCKHKIPWHYGQMCDEYDKNIYCSGCGFPFQPTNDGRTCNNVYCPFNGCNQKICR